MKREFLLESVHARYLIHFQFTVDQLNGILGQSSEVEQADHIAKVTLQKHVLCWKTIWQDVPKGLQLRVIFSYRLLKIWGSLLMTHWTNS